MCRVANPGDVRHWRMRRALDQGRDVAIEGSED